MRRLACAVAAAGLLACEARLLDVSGKGDAGAGCDPLAVTCQDGLVCARVDEYVCVAPVEIVGQVIDAASQAPIAGARVHAQDAAGSAPGATAVSDEDGRYVLQVDVPRADGGAPAAGVTVTLQAFAADHQPFPSGFRVALPIAVDEATLDEARGAYVIDDAALTTVALVALPDDQSGGVQISGRVGGEAPGGTLVVAEGPQPAAYGLAASDGTYTLFNVRAGAATVRGYRRDLALKSRRVEVAGEDLEGVDLEAADAKTGSVAGSVNLVDAGAGEGTSVVLIPASLYDEALARGPVPFGLRAPDPGRAPDIDKEFAIPGVPAGEYRVLAGFENDGLVRDPDTALGGTEVPVVMVKAGAAAQAPAFKITGAIAVVGPGAEGPETVTGAPTFRFAQDPGADHYEVLVYDALGDLVWQATAPKGSGSEPIAVEYAGPALTPGMYYQFRAVSLKDKEGMTALSATEDLRGVFVAAE